MSKQHIISGGCREEVEEVVLDYVRDILPPDVWLISVKVEVRVERVVSAPEVVDEKGGEA